MTFPRIICISYLLFLFFTPNKLQAETMQGMYSYRDDTGFFLDCQRQQRIPVAAEADHFALEKAYLKKHYLAGQALLVEVDGHIEQRPKNNSNGYQPTLIVEQFLKIREQETCFGPVPPSSLKNTYWKLVEIQGQKLSENTLWQQGQQSGTYKQREMYFVIKNHGDTLKGFGGCNYFSGPVINNDRDIYMGPFQHSQKPCPYSAIEGQFLHLLETVGNYRIKGESLELFDKQQSLAKFIAIYF